MLIEKILQAMIAQIEQHGLELMKHYPNDLLKIDRAIIERGAHPGASVAWMVGHSHTHTVLLGLHPKESEAVAYHLNLARDDRFYTLKIDANGFMLTEIDRDAYAQLQHTPIPYQRDGGANGFWLLRNGDRVGYCNITSTGNYQSRKWIAEITPASGIRPLDQAALHVWTSYAITELAGSLFAACEIHWKPALQYAP